MMNDGHDRESQEQNDTQDSLLAMESTVEQLHEKLQELKRRVDDFKDQIGTLETTAEMMEDTGVNDQQAREFLLG